MITTFIAYARARLAARRRYRQAIAEISAMSRQELLEMSAYESDLKRAARRQYLEA